MLPLLEIMSKLKIFLKNDEEPRIMPYIEELVHSTGESERMSKSENMQNYGAACILFIAFSLVIKNK